MNCHRKLLFNTLKYKQKNIIRLSSSCPTNTCCKPSGTMLLCGSVLSMLLYGIYEIYSDYQEEKQKMLILESMKHQDPVDTMDKQKSV